MSPTFLFWMQEKVRTLFANWLLHFMPIVAVGNASTKTRDEVLVSVKIYRQKGLGTGRAGDKRGYPETQWRNCIWSKPRFIHSKIKL